LSPFYDYECVDCHATRELFHPVNHKKKVECERCGAKSVKLIGTPVVVGTRDSFGIKNDFVDSSTGKTIDTWSKWEKAGYRDPISTTRNHDVKEKIKDKKEKKKRQSQ